MLEGKLVGAEGVAKRSGSCRKEISHQVVQDGLPSSILPLISDLERLKASKSLRMNCVTHLVTL